MNVSGCTYQEKYDEGFFVFPENGDISLVGKWTKQECIEWCIHRPDCSYVEWDPVDEGCQNHGILDTTVVMNHVFITLTCNCVPATVNVMQTTVVTM